ncbi:LuxR C-terminal-related transcriptional regulator [Actinophytocola sp.]|uniref:LuxR C-terminal-related transcriptional regulator n=1 Tax=Actinophytocola sp. TaxID=1872138 RepID=UPI00389A9A7F
MLYGRDEERAVIDALLAGAAAGRSGALVITGEPGIGKTALLDYAAAKATGRPATGTVAADGVGTGGVAAAGGSAAGTLATDGAWPGTVTTGGATTGVGPGVAGAAVAAGADIAGAGVADADAAGAGVANVGVAVGGARVAAAHAGVSAAGVAGAGVGLGSARLLRAAGAESEAELPFAGLQLLLRSVLGSLDALPEVQATALRGALGLAATEGTDRFLIGLAVLSLLSELDGPVVCVVDDAQWLGKESAEALLFAARRLDAEGVVLLFGAREEARLPGLPTLRLSGLDPAAAGALLDERGADLPAGSRYRLLAEAAGNPLALIELPAALPTASAAGGLPLTERLRAAFTDQLHRVPERTRTVLRVAAAEDTGDLAVVLRAAATLGASVHDLTPAEQAGLVRLSEDTLTFRHPLLRAAVYQDVPLGERLALHRALADALVGPQDADRRAWHLAAAATTADEEVAAALERVAGLAGRRSGHAAAAAAYERAARLTPDPTDRVRRLLLAAEAAGEAGAVDHALDLADRIGEPPADPLLRARLTQVVAFGRFWQGRQAEAYRLLAELAAEQTGHGAVETLVEAAYVAWFTGRQELADAVDRLGELRVPAGDRLSPLVRVLISGLSMALGRPAVAGELDSAVAAAVRAAGDDYRELLFVCGVQVATGRDRRAHESAGALVARTRASGRIAWLPNLLFLLAEGQLAHGQHRDAATTAEEALRIATDADLRQWHGQLAAVLAHVAAITGDEARCRELAEPVLADPDDPGLPRARWALGLLDLGLGRTGAALDRLTDLAGGPQRYGVSVTRSVPDLVEAAVRAGARDRAAEPFARFTAWAEQTGQAWAEALVLRCRALLAPDENAEQHYRDALARHQADHRPFERARTALLYGEWLRRARRKAEASTQLHTALADFQRLGATPWADRAVTELTATGVGGAVIASVPAGVAATLTPQELRIVRLAAGGLSNRDIAAQLFLSPRTVGYHLYKAYPKLGVLSRGELVDLDLG